jgi:hypothetical protein
MREEPFLIHQFREIMAIACRWVCGFQDSLSCGAMVGVNDSNPGRRKEMGRITSYENFRSHVTDDPDDSPPQFERRLQVAILIVQELNRFHPDHICGFLLFFLPPGAYPGRELILVPAFIAAGQQAIMDLVPFARQSCKRGSTKNFPGHPDAQG